MILFHCLSIAITIDFKLEEIMRWNQIELDYIGMHLGDEIIFHDLNSDTSIENKYL